MNMTAKCKNYIASMKKWFLENKVIIIIIFIAFLCLGLCFLWDCGTHDHVVDITFNPVLTDWSFSNIDINAFIQSIISALIGFCLSILIIDLVINKTREKEKAEKKERLVKTIMDLLVIPILDYSRAARIITNELIPCSKENNFKGGDYSLELPIRIDALMDIYNIAIYTDLGLETDKIDFYIESVENLRKTITIVLLNADLSNNHEKAEALMAYLNNTYYFYKYSKNLKVNKELYKSNSKIIEESLNKHVMDLDIPQDHIAYPFVALAKLLDMHDDFFHKILPDEYNALFIDKYL